LYLCEKHDALRLAMNVNISTTPSDLGLSPTLSLVDSCSMETPYLSAVDMLRMIADVISPSAKLNVIGMHVTILSHKDDMFRSFLGYMKVAQLF